MPSSPSPIVPTVSVIIVTYQRPDHLARALEHLSYVRSVRLEIVVVDASADPGSPEPVEGLPMVSLSANFAVEAAGSVIVDHVAALGSTHLRRYLGHEVRRAVTAERFRPRGRLQRVGIVGPALTSKLADRSSGDRARA